MACVGVAALVGPTLIVAKSLAPEPACSARTANLIIGGKHHGVPVNGETTYIIGPPSGAISHDVGKGPVPCHYFAGHMIEVAMLRCHNDHVELKFSDGEWSSCGR